MIHTFHNPLTYDVIREINNGGAVSIAVYVAAAILMFLAFRMLIDPFGPHFYLACVVVISLPIAIVIIQPDEGIDQNRDTWRIYSVAFQEEQEKQEFKKSVTQWYEDNGLSQEQFCNADSPTGGHRVYAYGSKSIDNLLQCGGRYSGFVEQEVERDGDTRTIIITSNITEEGISFQQYEEESTSQPNDDLKDAS